MSKGSDMLMDAARTIAERGRVYGDAAANMAKTAQLWSAVLGVDVTPVQCALCLIQLKVARLLVTPDHSDSAVDIAGYAAVLCETQQDV
jgi:hypothetical protein